MTLTEALILATALITGTGEPSPTDADPRSQTGVWERAKLPILRYAVIGLALDMEILDPRETHQFFTRPKNVGDDVHMLRQRYQELADAPRIADAYRFPDRATINEFLSFNRAYRNHLQMRLPLQMGRGGELLEAEREAHDLYLVYDTLREARCEYYYVTVRRQALKRLREMLGEDAYYRGQLPPHVPLWRFQEIN